MLKSLTVSVSFLAAASAACAAAVMAADAPVQHAAALTQEPLVMRLGKDEFRIAFGVNAASCATSGCNGVIRYRVDWKTDDGARASESRRVSFTVLPHYRRALTVDRQYFDTAEGAHTTDIIKVTVEKIVLVDGLYANPGAPSSRPTAQVVQADTGLGH